MVTETAGTASLLVLLLIFPVMVMVWAKEEKESTNAISNKL
jgi:hypothetical protein